MVGSESALMIPVREDLISSETKTPARSDLQELPDSAITSGLDQQRPRETAPRQWPDQ